MRCHTVLLSAALTLTLAAGVEARESIIAQPSVRPLSEASGALMADAQQRSATVRDLFSKLDGSNLVVYVYVAPLANGSPESALSFVGATKAQRFVLIRIADSAAADRRIELLGHELQHATEVAGATWVKSQVELANMMSIVGWREPNRAFGYETTAANKIETQVRRDVRTAAGTR